MDETATGKTEAPVMPFDPKVARRPFPMNLFLPKHQRHEKNRLPRNCIEAMVGLIAPKSENEGVLNPVFVHDFSNFGNSPFSG